VQLNWSSCSQHQERVLRVPAENAIGMVAVAAYPQKSLS
jgi:hypothetical protein